jgi:chromosome condensin MukBEF ATPase and DNA-binding subunit MukB
MDGSLGHKTKFRWGAAVMAMDTAKNQTEMYSESSKLTKLRSALTDMATLRNGTLTKESLRLYSQRLAKEEITDVLAMLETLGEQKRTEFEASIPEIGVMLALTRVEETARRNRDEVAKSERFVRWKCPVCGATLSGFPTRNDSLDRYCEKKASLNELGNPVECGTPMNIIFKDAA